MQKSRIRTPDDVQDIPPVIVQSDSVSLVREPLEALPTFAMPMNDDDDIMEVPDYVEQEWNAIGMVTDRQWNIWAQWCRRGVQEV